MLENFIYSLGRPEKFNYLLQLNKDFSASAKSSKSALNHLRGKYHSQKEHFFTTVDQTAVKQGKFQFKAFASHFLYLRQGFYDAKLLNN